MNNGLQTLAISLNEDVKKLRHDEKIEGFELGYRDVKKRGKNILIEQNRLEKLLMVNHGNGQVRTKSAKFQAVFIIVVNLGPRQRSQAMKLDLNSPHLPGPKPQLQGLVELFPGLFGIPDDEGRGRPDPEIYGLNEDLPKLLKVQVLVDELLLPLGTRVDAEKQGA